MIYEHSLADVSTFLGSRVVNNLELLKIISDTIVKKAMTDAWITHEKGEYMRFIFQRLSITSVQMGM